MNAGMLSAILIVADRDHCTELAARCEALGGGWLQGLVIFQRETRMRFVVMCADSAERIVNGTPLVQLVLDETQLQTATIFACREVHGRLANKLFLGPETRAIVDEVLLAAAVTQGRG